MKRVGGEQVEEEQEVVVEAGDAGFVCGGVGGDGVDEGCAWRGLAVAVKHGRMQYREGEGEPGHLWLPTWHFLQRI